MTGILKGPSGFLEGIFTKSKISIKNGPLYQVIPVCFECMFKFIRESMGMNSTPVNPHAFVKYGVACSFIWLYLA